MIVEFLCRYAKPMGNTDMEEIETELNIQEIIQGENFDRETAKETMVSEAKLYDYGAVLFSLKDVESANAVDQEHTAVKFYTGLIRIIKINYEEYKQYYQMLTHQVINSFITGSGQFIEENG